MNFGVEDPGHLLESLAVPATLKVLVLRDASIPESAFTVVLQCCADLLTSLEELDLSENGVVPQQSSSALRNLLSGTGRRSLSLKLERMIVTACINTDDFRHAMREGRILAKLSLAGCPHGDTLASVLADCLESRFQDRDNLPPRGFFPSLDLSQTSMTVVGLQLLRHALCRRPEDSVSPLEKRKIASARRAEGHGGLHYFPDPCHLMECLLLRGVVDASAEDALYHEAEMARVVTIVSVTSQWVHDVDPYCQ